MHTFAQKELFPPHSVNTTPLAPPQSGTEPLLSRVIAVQHSPVIPTSKPLKLICQFLSAWKTIPRISLWLLSIIEHWYALQFRRWPPCFDGVAQSLTLPQNALILRQELCNLLEKGAIERVPGSKLESIFFRRYFVVPKRDGGLRSILYLRPINRALWSIHSGRYRWNRSWRRFTLYLVASVVLKNTYFHIQIAPHHRRFLRFALEGTAYQYPVLLFKLAFATHTFSKCMDTAPPPQSERDLS